jgi:lipopolysaccharide export LptBFGC system permease protein LptF
MSLQRIGTYAGAVLLAGLAAWFFGGVAIDALIASRLKAHEAKLEAMVQDKEAEIKAIQGEVTTLTVERNQALADAKMLAKEAERLSTEKVAWMKQADALAKRAQSIQQEVARVPDAQVGQEIRAALAELRAGVSTACPIR